MKMIRVCFVAIAVAIIPGAPVRSSSPIAVEHRDIKVFDGDSIQIGSSIWQLSGIDAPELGQVCNNNGHLWRCGLAAAYRLRQIVNFKSTPINCYPQHDAPDHAICMAGDQDISMILIESGYAASITNGPLMYGVAERKARKASLGIWGGPFVYPWDWREGSRLGLELTSDSPVEGWDNLPWGLDKTLSQGRVEHSECVIKGIGNGDREHFYYGFLDVEYPDIKIDPKRGDRLFCSDDEARLAGWRHQGETVDER